MQKQANSDRSAALPAASDLAWHAENLKRFKTIRPEDVRWVSFPAYPPQVRMAIVVGDPTEPAPYLIRVHVPGGTRMMPHRHPEDRIYTVMAGIFYVGLGEEFDERELQAYGVGSVVVLPGGQSHFHWARSGDYICQVSAVGPLGFTYVDPSDDPGHAHR